MLHEYRITKAHVDKQWSEGDLCDLVPYYVETTR